MPPVTCRTLVLKRASGPSTASEATAVATFVVDGVQKVAKDAFPTASIYGKAGYPSLRLITCGGPFDRATGHYLDNIIVYAHLITS